jgi:PQQ-dependent catabolism-associated CXXCW motif protein
MANIRLHTLVVVALLRVLPAGAEGYRMADYRAPTPPGLDGAVTVDTGQARALLDQGAVIPIDVLPAQRSPNTGVWLLPKPRPELPGSLWLANVGYGDLPPAMEDWFRARLQAITSARPSAGLLFYCLSDCWMSWNAAKRAVAWGYGRVYWYPDGTDGWARAGLPLETGTPQGP